MKNKKGFTLIEIVVVLLILAILAAIAVPSLTGFIDDAKERGIISECRSCVLASTTVAVERYAMGDPVTNENCMSSDFIDRVTDYAEIPKDGSIDSMVFDSSSLTELLYTRNNTTVKYSNGKYTILDKESTSDNDITFTPIGSLTGSDKEDAIKANADALVRLFNKCMQEELAKVSQDIKIEYWKKPDYSLSGTLPGCDFFDASSNKVVSGYTLDIGPEINEVLGRYNISMGTAKLFFDTVNVNGTSMRSITPYKLQFKSAGLTGDTSTYYTYNIATGELKKGQF